MKDSTKRWWYTKPDPEDIFFVHIRELFQILFVCKHKWLYKQEEGHGRDLSKRFCTVCGKKQILIYHRFGNIRTEWKDVIASSKVILP